MPGGTTAVGGVSGGPDWNVSGPEWNVGGVDGLGSGGPDGTSQASSPEGFGGMLAGQVQKLGQVQNDAAAASQALATGTTTDVSSVVMAVERAKLSMQLAAQLRNKTVDAYQEVFRTQV